MPHAIKMCLSCVYPWCHTIKIMYSPLWGEPENEARTMSQCTGVTFMILCRSFELILVWPFILCKWRVNNARMLYTYVASHGIKSIICRLKSTCLDWKFVQPRFLYTMASSCINICMELSTRFFSFLTGCLSFDTTVTVAWNSHATFLLRASRPHISNRGRPRIVKYGGMGGFYAMQTIHLFLKDSDLPKPFPFHLLCHNVMHACAHKIYIHLSIDGFNLHTFSRDTCLCSMTEIANRWRLDRVRLAAVANQVWWAVLLPSLL